MVNPLGGTKELGLNPVFLRVGGVYGCESKAIHCGIVHCCCKKIAFSL